MSRNRNKLEFMSYITTPLSDDSITILYSTNNVKFDRVNLYLDFVLSLLHIVFDTYLGDDITNNKQQMKHFDWCWEKNINNFKKESIAFENNPELKNYFKEFMLEVFYNLDGKDNNPYVQNNIINLWTHILNYNGIKSRADVDSFIEIYNIFDKSLKNI
jgi:hypothetical protein